MTESVAIVIPCYDCSGTLKRAIDSVVNQSININEIIVVDDCSKDAHKISDICNTCNGTSAYDPNDLVICLYCSGTNNNCSSCNGKGNMFKIN